MNYLTTTQLRTKSSVLVDMLLAGDAIDLIHRSRVVGAIVPKTTEKEKVIDPKKFAATLKSLEPSRKIPTKQLMKRYEHYMMYRHGPALS